MWVTLDIYGDENALSIEVHDAENRQPEVRGRACGTADADEGWPSLLPLRMSGCHTRFDRARRSGSGSTQRRAPATDAPAEGSSDGSDSSTMATR